MCGYKIVCFQEFQENFFFPKIFLNIYEEKYTTLLLLKTNK